VLTAQIGVRLTEEDREILFKVCEARGEDVSDFVRRAIRKELAGLGFYPNDVRKALGMKGEAGSDRHQ